MCTVSIIPLRFAAPRGHVPVVGYRLVTNRDERRDRAPAEPPQWRPPSGRSRDRALFPTDSAAGGTWIAVAESGLSLCLLNGNPRPYPDLPPPEHLLSRGGIIPQMLAAGVACATDIIRTLEQFDLDRFAPFTLLAVDVGGPDAARPGTSAAVRLARVTWDRARIHSAIGSSPPTCLVSSGLGDALAHPRLALFDRFIAEGGARPEVQDRFHRHVWRDRPEISVMMSRHDARTVSVTTVEAVAASHASPARVTMRYLPLDRSPSLASRGEVVFRTAGGVTTLVPRTTVAAG